MATETKLLGQATCPVRWCTDDAHYKTTKNPRVFNYRCSTGEHWGHLRVDALGATGAHIELEFWAEVNGDESLKAELARAGELMREV